MVWIPFKNNKPLHKILWEVPKTICTKCKGSGWLYRKNKKKACYKCNGKGKF